MKRIFSTLLGLMMTMSALLAQGFPETSTADNPRWYLIQFMNGGNALTAATPDANITTTSATGGDEQQWMVSGDETGYTLTNKKGYTLYVNAAAKNEMVKASANPTGVSKFTITASGSGYELHPVGNANISMNLWGGPNENRGVGLWDNNDQNNTVTFADASVLENMGKYALIPYPAELTVTKEGELNICSLNAIAYNSDAMQEHAEAFAAQLKTAAGITLAVKKAAATATPGEIWFGTDEALPRDGYTLVVKEGGVEIKTSSYGGELYALQTLIQLLPSDFFSSTLVSNECSGKWSLPMLSIKDKPQFEHRGFMMDVSRHFFDKDEVKKVLDIMAFYKLNRFHWHLTDDQGWRIEIPEYPLLTEVGAIRSGSFTNADGQNFYDDTEYGRGMWFSQDDLREIVAYATARNIDILPEIDLPGHMVAAVASYPELSCDPTKKYEVRIDGGISKDVLNVGKDEVIDFLKCVLGHVAEIFPFPYIHLGGDECPTDQWQGNADCLRRVQEEGLAGVHELQSWLVEELGKFLKSEYGKDIIVWDEVLAHWNNNNTVRPVVMAWNSGGAPSGTAASYGLKSIMCPHSHVYIDFPQVPENQRLIDEPYNGGWGVNTVEKVYSLNPVAYLSGKEEYCWGAQANLWAETLNDNEELEYQLLPRILALAEVGWLPNSQKNWMSFYKRLQSHDEVLDLRGYTYAKHYIEPTEYTEHEQAMMEAESILNASIRGGVGYPSAEAYDALMKAYQNERDDAGATLREAIAAYKAAPIVQPEAGKTYRIISASTYYKRQYEGSSMYQKGDGVRFHYTPQTEPEELWQFTATEGGYLLTNLYSKSQLAMEGYNKAITMKDKGTPIRIDKATIAAGGYTYIPGAVTISAVEGYNAAVTGSVKRLSAEVTGDVYAKDEAALCYNGTWRIEEVTDYTLWLQGLVDKCELIVLTAKPGEVNQPTTEALGYLQSDVIAPAKETLGKGAVSEEQYAHYVALYLLFQQMERTSIAQSLDEGYYYYLRNVWFGKYAAYDSNSKTVNQKNKGEGDNYLWSIVKRPDGAVYLINKATGTAAYPTAHNGDQAIKLGEDYAWTLEERTLDGKTGICIIDASGNNSWYTNPDVWAYILLKPFWGACTWEFQKSAVEVPASIGHLTGESTQGVIYDLHGRRVGRLTQPGVYICDGNKIVK